jgi:hypothetical protein
MPEIRGIFRRTTGNPELWIEAIDKGPDGLSKKQPSANFAPNPLRAGDESCNCITYDPVAL